MLGLKCSITINSSREIFINSTTSSMNYINCIQAQSGNLTQAEQVEKEEIQDPPLSYVSLETASLKLITNYIYISNSIDTSNMLSSSSLEPSVILYQDNQLANL